MTWYAAKSTCPAPPLTNREAIAPLYTLRSEQVEVIPYPAALAIKIVMDRKVVDVLKQLRKAA